MSWCRRCKGRRIVGAIGVDAQREAAAAAGEPDVAEADCVVCEGAFAEADHWLTAALAALETIDAATFQVGTVFPTECEAIEKDAMKAAGEDAITDSLRTEANRLIAPQIAEATGMAWMPDGRPDVSVLVDTRFWSASLRTNSLFVAGRYTKHRRDLPQTHWPCKRCQGKGCWDCDDAGVLYASSVEDVIGAAAAPAFGASGFSFHGAGREDIDALMLGDGRPFVLELHEPARRTVDLVKVEAAINATTETSGAGVQGLRITEKEEVARIKGATYDKQYVAHCLTESPVTQEAVEAAAGSMTGQVLAQRTPERVSHRRADLVRDRTVHEITIHTPVDEAGTRFSIAVLAESGTYIKEMVSSDDGRTTPSFADRLGVPCVVEFLDVLAILDDGGDATPGEPAGRRD